MQAVSIYVRALVDEGLLEPSDAGHHLSPKGLQRLHEGVRRLREEVDAVVAPLNVIRVTSAIAKGRIAQGERVGLFMEEGELVARPRARSASTGRAANDAEVGDEVVVTDLSGVVALEPGAIRVVAVPAPLEGGVARVDVARLRGSLKDKPGKVGVVGTGARVLAHRLGARVDFEFAAERAAFNAAERGLDVRLFVSRDRLPDVMQALEQLNAATLRRVPVEMVEAPEVPA